MVDAIVARFSTSEQYTPVLLYCVKEVPKASVSLNEILPIGSISPPPPLSVHIMLASYCVVTSQLCISALEISMEKIQAGPTKQYLTFLTSL